VRERSILILSWVLLWDVGLRGGEGDFLEVFL